MALFWRIWAALTVVNFAVLTIFVGLAILQFANINSRLVGERLLVLADRTAAPFEAVARIGLPLSTVRNAEALLERARQTDDAIDAVHVFDAAQRIVHSTATPKPAAIPTEAILARAAANGASWHGETEDGFFSGIDIFARDGVPVGGIVIVYPGGGNATRIKAMAAELALGAIIVSLAVMLLCTPLLKLVLKRQIGLFDSIDQAIHAFERSAWRSAAGSGNSTEEDQTLELRALLQDAESQYRSAGRALTSDSDGSR